MSNKDFSGPTRSVVRGGQRGAVERPIVVPQRHNNIHKVFGGVQTHNSVASSKPMTSAQPIQKTAVTTKPASPTRHLNQAVQPKKTPVIHLEDIVGSVPRKAAADQKKTVAQSPRPGVTPTAIQRELKQIATSTAPKSVTAAPLVAATSSPAKTKQSTTTPVTPTASKESKSTINAEAPLLAEKKKRSSRSTKAFKKAQAKAEKVKRVATERMEQAVKSAALSPEPVASSQRVLAPAASAANTATVSAPITSNSGAAVATQSNFVTRVAGAPRITLTFKVDSAKFFAVLRALIVAIILAVSGYLAWDTWMTNKSVESTFGNPAAAMSVESTNPATADPTSISNEAWAAYTTPADQPRYIFIPSINVKARVMSAGVTSQGGIDTPKNLNDTAWYDGSAKPGKDGQVFIDGHTSFSSNLAAAFNDLPKLNANDQIIVELGDGQQISYRVSATETVAADQVDMNKVLSPPADYSKGLTLMTCTGKFDYRTQNSSQRFIVTAVQE